MPDERPSLTEASVITADAAIIKGDLATLRENMGVIKAQVARMPGPLCWMILAASWFFFISVVAG